MTARVLFLVAAAAAFWLALGLPARQLAGDEAIVHAGVAVLLSLVPGVLTLVWAGWAYRQNPQQELLAALGATGLRMFVVLVSALLLHQTVGYFHSPAFLLWVAGAYCFLLAVEVVLLVRGRAAQPKSDAGA
ncbi:MAG: hypothetical protein ACRC33_26385 [Gemmataceae bacterium]